MWLGVLDVVGDWLTRALERVAPKASIQMYSAMMLPFWSRFVYFWSCRGETVSILSVCDGGYWDAWTHDLVARHKLDCLSRRDGC